MRTGGPDPARSVPAVARIRRRPLLQWPGGCSRGDGRGQRIPPAPDRLPREPVGAAHPGRAPGAGALRGRRAAVRRRGPVPVRLSPPGGRPRPPRRASSTAAASRTSPRRKSTPGAARAPSRPDGPPAAGRRTGPRGAWSWADRMAGRCFPVCRVVAGPGPGRLAG
ncbi:hypothetical protein KPATCC21470_0918 [Kitasatospora purpeofusca]